MVTNSLLAVILLLIDRNFLYVAATVAECNKLLVKIGTAMEACIHGHTLE